MNHRRMLILGVVLLVFGCIASLYLAAIITSARIEGAFTGIVTDSPTNQFEHLKCPLLLSKNETASVVATISNLTGDSLDYLVRIEAYGLSIRSPAEEKVSIPGGQTARVSWDVMAVESGNQAIVVQAVSSADLALPGTFHAWPTSFRQVCGIRAIDGPLTGKQVLLLSLTSILVGAVISFPRLYAKIRQRASAKTA